MQTILFWHVALSSLAERQQAFGGIHCLYHRTED
jgi:hypothetical protein